MSLRSHADFSLSLIVLVTLACSLEPPSGAYTSDDAARVELGPDFGGGQLGPVLQITGFGDSDTLPRLFDGELSDYHRSRADAPTLPSTLEARRIPLWKDPRGTAAVALGWLEPGRLHTLLVGKGVVVPVLPSADPPRLERIWPSANATRRAAFCQVSTAPTAIRFGSGASLGGNRAADSILSDGTAARWEPLDRVGRCWLLELGGSIPDGGSVSPLSFRGAVVEPTLFTSAQQAELDPPECVADEQPLLVGCASVQDDRVVLRGPGAATLWIFDGALQGVLALDPGGRAVLRGLSAGDALETRVRVLLSDGSEWSQSLLIEPAPQRPHVVINEVLSNPVGAEPAQEWVELYNDGADSVNLLGWAFSDGGAEVSLPDARLEPGSYALLVGMNFDAAPDWDVAPAPGTLLLRLQALGKGGLANSGEPLRLITDTGLVASRFPPLASPGPGLSIARRQPDALDDEPAAFGEHSDLGASPGAVNSLE